jgi:hypothetical protein
MHVVDESVWRAQKAELSGNEDGKIFLKFLEDWVDMAEAGVGTVGVAYLTPLECLHTFLVDMEKREGHLSLSWLAQMLLVIVANWEYGGEKLFEEMTIFEQRIVLGAQQEAIAVMQDKAVSLGNLVPTE